MSNKYLDLIGLLALLSKTILAQSQYEPQSDLAYTWRAMV